jgi:hypothetical protein
MTLYSLIGDYRHFGGTYCLHLQHKLSRVPCRLYEILDFMAKKNKTVVFYRVVSYVVTDCFHLQGKNTPKSEAAEGESTPKTEAAGPSDIWVTRSKVHCDLP